MPANKNMALGQRHVLQNARPRSNPVAAAIFAMYFSNLKPMPKPPESADEGAAQSTDSSPSTTSAEGDPVALKTA
jgi:hypothetical protein